MIELVQFNKIGNNSIGSEFKSGQNENWTKLEGICNGFEQQNELTIKEIGRINDLATSVDASTLHPFLLADFNGKKNVVPIASSFENGAAAWLTYDVTNFYMANSPIEVSSDFYTESQNISQVKIKVINGDSINNIGPVALNSEITPVTRKRIHQLNFKNSFKEDCNFVHVFIWAYAIDINKQTEFFYKNIKTTIFGQSISPVRITTYPEKNGSVIDTKNLPVQLSLEKDLPRKINSELATRTSSLKGFDIKAKGNALNKTKVQLDFVFDVSSLGLTTEDIFSFQADVSSTDSNVIQLESQYFFNNGAAPGDSSGTQLPPSGVKSYKTPRMNYMYIDNVRAAQQKYIHCFLNVILSDGTTLTNLKVNNVSITIRGNTYVYSKVENNILYRANPEDYIAYKEFPDENLVTFGELPSYVVINNLVGKKINLLGDSITAGHTLGFSNTWGYAIAKRNKMNVRNYGINGTCLAGTSNASGASMATRYVDMDNESDYIIVMGGTNDQGSGNIPIGTDDDVTVDTFKGALNVLCKGLIEKYPKSKIGFMTPYHNHNNANGNGAKIIDYVNAIIEICGNYGIPVLDNYRSGGLLPVNAVQRSALMMPDGIHPTAEGHQFISKRIEGFINSL
ncbi:GDSL-type esterase/lipase family protein [Bacillus pacificus]|uniref:GDSL-type esterase/lipase family protein n=1 Tax=Bacillus pacificus TaxID=2026187 RepID=UPI0039805FD7